MSVHNLAQHFPFPVTVSWFWRQRDSAGAFKSLPLPAVTPYSYFITNTLYSTFAMATTGVVAALALGQVRIGLKIF